MTEPHEVTSNELGVKDVKENDYRVMVYKSKEITGSVMKWTFIQRSKKEWTKRHDDIRDSEDCLFFEDNIPMEIPSTYGQSVFYMDDYLSHVLNRTIAFDSQYFDSQYIDRIIENMRKQFVDCTRFGRINENTRKVVNRILNIITENMREAIVEKIIDRIIENMREVVHLTE